MHGWHDHDLLRRGLAIFGLESLAATVDAPAEAVELAEKRLEARERRDFEASDRLRAQIEALGWVVRDEPDGYSLVPKA